MNILAILDPYEDVFGDPEEEDFYKADVAELTGVMLLFLPKDLNEILPDILSNTLWDYGVGFAFGPETNNSGALSESISCYEWMRHLPAFLNSTGYKINIGNSENQHSIHAKDGSKFSSLSEVEKAVEFVKTSLESALQALGVPLKVINH